MMNVLRSPVQGEPAKEKIAYKSYNAREKPVRRPEPVVQKTESDEVTRYRRSILQAHLPHSFVTGRGTILHSRRGRSAKGLHRVWA